MKKNYSLFLIFLFPALLQAQPTLTSNDLPYAGLAFRLAKDSTFTDPVQGGGINANWNYNGLANNYIDTTSFAVAAGTPYAATFNGSNLSTYDPTDDSYTYYHTNSTGFYVDGFASAGGNFKFTSPQLFAPVPFTYLNTITNVARTSIDTVVPNSTGTGVYRLRVKINITSQFLADGYGTLILPNGTHNNTLRLKITETTYDSILVDTFSTYILLTSGATQVTRLRWFEPGAPVTYICGMDADSLGNTTTSSEYFLDALSLRVPEVDNRVQSPVFYPNPSSGSLNMMNPSTDPSAELSLYDESGKLIERRTIGSTPVVNLDLRSIANGIYHCNLRQGTRQQETQIIIQH